MAIQWDKFTVKSQQIPVQIGSAASNQKQMEAHV